MRIRLLFLCLIFSLILQGQESIEKLGREITGLTYHNQYDSAEVLVLHFLEKKDLSPVEIFFGNYFFGDILKSSNKVNEAIKRLLACKKYLAGIPDNKIYGSLIDGDVAECYFNMSDYKASKKYALLSVEASPDSSLRGSGHAVNYLILGYSDYVAKNYKTALDWYAKSIKIYRSYGEQCELPLCFMKLAKVYNSMGNEKAAVEKITQAIRVSDSCNIRNYVLLSERTLFDIYKENKNYEKALSQLEKINDLVAELEYAKQGQVMSEMEVRYNTMMAEKENEDLKKINEANERTMVEQRRVLYITLAASVVLFALVIFLVILSGQRKKARHELQQLNADLEKKVRERTRELDEDIKIRKKLEQQLKEKIMEMETLISKLSHDMRSPLSSVLGLVNVAELAPQTNTSQYFEKIKESIRKLDNIILDLTSTIYVSTMQNKPEVINFDKVIRETLSFLEYRENFKKTRFNTRIEQASNFTSDARFIHSILQNLIENAIKYGNQRDEARIDIIVQGVENGVTIRIIDNGIGIEPEYHDKVFDMFFRGTDQAKGTGLGLYIVKKSVEKLKGKITLESELMKGSTFTVFLPDMTRG